MEYVIVKNTKNKKLLNCIKIFPYKIQMNLTFLTFKTRPNPQPIAAKHRSDKASDR